MTYEKLTSTYRYIRSMRKVIEKSNWEWPAMKHEVEYLLSQEGFGNESRIQKLVNNFTREGVGPKVPYSIRQYAFDAQKEKWPGRTNTAVEKADKHLDRGCRLNRASNWQWRLQQEIQQSLEKNWYCLFGTYTVDPQRLPKGCLTRDELWTNTPAWDRFIKRMKAAVAEADAQGRQASKWEVPASNWFKYLAVLEHGKSGKHPHVHVVFMCRAIPASWKIDPNKGYKHGTKVDIPAASALWYHGVQRKTVGLFIRGSWFEKNWNIPCDVETGEVKKVGDAGSVSGYVGKYMQKEGEKKCFSHRVKATRRLGIQRLKEQLTGVSTTELLQCLSQRPQLYSVWMKLQNATSIPLNLLREKSKQVLLNRLIGSVKLSEQKYLWQELTKKPQKFYTNLMFNVRDGMKPWSEMPERRYNIFSQIIGDVETIHSEKNIQKMLTWLKQNIPPNVRTKKLTLLKGIPR